MPWITKASLRTKNNSRIITLPDSDYITEPRWQKHHDTGIKSDTYVTGIL
jgi:hypothetical protein